MVGRVSGRDALAVCVRRLERAFSCSRFFAAASAAFLARSRLLVDVGDQVGELAVVFNQQFVAGLLSAQFFFELRKGTFATGLFAFEFRSIFLFGRFNADKLFLRFVRLCRHDFDVLAAIGQTIDCAILFAGHVLQYRRHACNVVGVAAGKRRLPGVSAGIDKLCLADADDEVFGFRHVQAHDACLAFEILELVFNILLFASELF